MRRCLKYECHGRDNVNRRINKETEFILNYLDIDAPERLESVEDGANVILVDHNSPAESVDNLENAKILKVVDHHKLALETSYPLFLRKL